MTEQVFKDGFLWGGATAANQFEGGYDECVWPDRAVRLL